MKRKRNATGADNIHIHSSSLLNLYAVMTEVLWWWRWRIVIEVVMTHITHNTRYHDDHHNGENSTYYNPHVYSILSGTSSLL
jgi:hypothetical protein